MRHLGGGSERQVICCKRVFYFARLRRTPSWQGRSWTLWMQRVWPTVLSFILPRITGGPWRLNWDATSMEAGTGFTKVRLTDPPHSSSVVFAAIPSPSTERGLCTLRDATNTGKNFASLLQAEVTTCSLEI